MRPATISQNRHDTAPECTRNPRERSEPPPAGPRLAEEALTMDRSAFFAGWAPLARTLVLGTSAYLIAVGALRLFGKRTLASFNVFDLVVSVALGNVLAMAALDSRISLAQGVVAFVLLA